MATEDQSQTLHPAPSPVDQSQVVVQPVTATVTPVDNATPPVNNPAPPAEMQTNPEPGLTGEVVDEGKKSYEERLKAHVTGQPAPTPATPAAPQAPVTEAPAPAPQASTEEEFPSAPPPGERMPQIKLRPTSPVDLQIMSEYKASQQAGNTETLVEFIQKRYPAPGASASTPAPQATPTAEPANPATVTDEPNTVDAIDAKLRELRLARNKALVDDFDADKADQIEEDMEKLRQKREDLRVEAITQREQAQTAAEQADAAALSKVAALYPQVVGNPTDALVLKAQAVVQQWQEENNPLLQQPNRFYHAYVEAAAQLGVAPGAATAPVSSPPSSPTPPVHRTPVSSAIIASGAANSTTRAPVTVQKTYEERLQEHLRAPRAA